MGFACPFKNAKAAPNPVANAANEMIAAGKYVVNWTYPTFPSEDYKNNLGSFMAAYASDKSDAAWEGVKTAFVDNWKAEWDKVDAANS